MSSKLLDSTSFADTWSSCDCPGFPLSFLHQINGCEEKIKLLRA